MPEHTPAPSPSRAVYGFVLYLSFQIFFIIYIIWALVPEEYFQLIGITFLPQRYWAVAVPVFFLIVLTMSAFIIYPCLGLSMTPNVNNLRTIKDEVERKRKSNDLHTKTNGNNDIDLCICKNKDKCCREYYESVQLTTVNKSIPSLRDIDMWDVSEILFLK